MTILSILVLTFSSNIYAKFIAEDIEVPSSLLQADNKKLVKNVIKNFKKVFASDALKKGAIISINDVWWSNTFNAYVMKYGPLLRITVHGGLLKNEMLTEDILNLILCHELGHLLGGAPKFNVVGKKWSSYEGQGDYYTGKSCLKKLYSKNDFKLDSIDPFAQEKCDEVYKDLKDKRICYKVSQTAIETGKFIAAVIGKNDPSLETPDSNIVEQTYKDHPALQCRIDTYFQANLCNDQDQLSDKNEAQGACSKKALGARPKCWYFAQ